MEKAGKRLLCIICTLVIFFSLGFHDVMADTSGFKPKRSSNTCFFGAYEQDGITWNGKEPIEWIILTEDEESYYLLSKDILDVVMYNQTKVDVTWETCSLRTWLSSTFLNSAFSITEQSKLYSVCVENNNGNEVWDRAFCLSEEEIISFLPEKADRVAYPTVYVTKNQEYTNGNGPGVWWLRSASNYDGFIRTASDVWTSGEIGFDNIRCATVGVRPVICVQRTAVSFKKPENRIGEESSSGSFIPAKKKDDKTDEGINGTEFYIPSFGCTFTCPSNWNPFIRDLTDEQLESYGLMREYVDWCLDSLKAEFGASNYDYGAVMSAYATPNGTDMNLKDLEDAPMHQLMDRYIKALNPDGTIEIKNPSIIHTADNCYIRYEFTTGGTVSSFYIMYVTFMNQTTYEFAFSNQHAYTKELTDQIESIIQSIRWDVTTTSKTENSFKKEENKSSSDSGFSSKANLIAQNVPEIPLTISVPDNMQVLDETERKLAGYNTTQYKFYAKSDDGSGIRVKIINDNYSFDMSVLKSMPETEREEIINSIGALMESQYGATLTKAELAEINGTIYLLTACSSKMYNTSKVLLSYTTVVNQKFFSVEFDAAADSNGQCPEESALCIEEIMKTIRYNDEKENVSSSKVSQLAGIDGTWITTEVKIEDLAVTGLSEEEAKRQIEEANQQLRDGLVTQTLVFEEGKVTFTQRLEGAMTGKSQATENVATGTYTLDGNMITMKLVSEGIVAPDMVATLNGNQIEWEVSGMTMVFTRK